MTSSRHSANFWTRLPLAGAAGLCAGLAAVAGWRYMSPRTLIGPVPPPYDADGGSDGVLFRYDYLQYVSGPQWTPTLGVVPFACALLAVLVCAAACRWAPQRLHRSAWQSALVSSSVAALTAGIFAAVYAHRHPPQIVFKAVVDPTYSPANYPDALVRHQIEGEPLFVDALPSYLAPSILALFAAAIAVLALHATASLIHAFTSRRSGPRRRR